MKDFDLSDLTVVLNDVMVMLERRWEAAGEP